MFRYMTIIRELVLEPS